MIKTIVEEEEKIRRERLSPDINLLPDSKPYRYLPDVFSHEYSVAKEEPISPQFSDFDTNSYPSSPSLNAIKDDYLSSSDSTLPLVFEPKIEISASPSPPEYVDVDLTNDNDDSEKQREINEELSNIRESQIKFLTDSEHEYKSSSDSGDSTVEPDDSSGDERSEER